MTTETINNTIKNSTVQVQPWFTVEVLFYGLIISLGLALRLWNLGHYPLSNSEALPSLLAFQLAGGDTLPTDIVYSPLLVSLNSLIFFLIHESDASARLSTVIFGTALILLPLTLRRQLGPLVCLLASALLAISPVAIFLSRTINSEITVTAGALMMLAGLFNWAEDGRQRWLYLLTGGLAVLLTAGPLAYTMLVIFTLIILIQLTYFKDWWAKGLTLSQPDNTESEEGLSSLQKAGIFLGVALILLATAATINLSGFGQMTGLLGDWISRFGFDIGSNTGFNAVFSLTIYEPLLVIVGLVGLAYAIVGRNKLHLIFAGWFVGSLLIDLFMGGRPNGSLILSLVPLVFLASLALAELFESLGRGGSWSNEGIIMASGLVIVGFGYIGMTGWIIRDCTSDDTFCQLAWFQAVAALALFFVIVAFFWFINGAGTAIRGTALTGLVLGLIAAVSIGWRLNYGPLMNFGYQPLAGITASSELVSLIDTLASESSMRVGDETLIDITLVNASPSMQWQLRNYKKQTTTNSLNDLFTTTAVITPAPPEGEDYNLGDAYVGQDFGLTSVWSPVGLPPKELLNWLIYRAADTRPDSDRAVLWLRINQPQP